MYASIMESITEYLSRNSNSSCVLELFVEGTSRLKALSLGHHDDFTIITGRCQPWASTLCPSCNELNQSIEPSGTNVKSHFDRLHDLLPLDVDFDQPGTV